MSFSLGTYKYGSCSWGVRGFDAGEINRYTLHVDAALQGSSVKGAGEGDVRGRSLDRDVDGEAEFVHAQVPADDRGGAALAGESAGDGAVLFHGEVSGGFLGTIGCGVGKLPLAAEIAFRRILELVWFANHKSAAVDKNHFDFCFFFEEVAISDHEIGNFPVFDGAQAVRHAKDFGCRERQRAKSGIRRETRIDGFLGSFKGVLRRGEAAGIKCKFDASFGQRRR